MRGKQSVRRPHPNVPETEMALAPDPEGGWEGQSSQGACKNTFLPRPLPGSSLMSQPLLPAPASRACNPLHRGVGGRSLPLGRGPRVGKLASPWRRALSVGITNSQKCGKLERDLLSASCGPREAGEWGGLQGAEGWGPRPSLTGDPKPGFRAACTPWKSGGAPHAGHVM